jgi:choline/glycine/proline betaine transport protein
LIETSIEETHARCVNPDYARRVKKTFPPGMRWEGVAVLSSHEKPISDPPISRCARIGWRKVWGLELHPTVFFVSAGLIFLFVAATITGHESAESVFAAVQGFIAHGFGWFYILTVDILFVFSLFLLLGPFGKIRLGGRDARPDFSLWSWFAMLFSAGMGIGLLFWSVAEPLSHFAVPPRGDVEPAGVDAAKEAMLFTYFHWGFHAWAIYATIGLALAFFAYNWKLPLTVRSIFYPLLGEKIHGWPGNVIDILAVVATLFGVATSLGFGAGQVNAGLHFLIPAIPESGLLKIAIIAGITALATLSVVLGLDKGIRRLSEINLIIGLVLLLFVLTVGPTLFLLNTTLQNTGNYLSNLTSISFWTAAYSNNNWQEGWTIFYWGWWISWSPFVGMFIARISRGRTIRQFLLGVLLVPTTLTFIWLSVFGNSALYVELFGAGGLLAVVDENVALALFAMLGQFSLGGLACALAIFAVVTFFVTSSDSGSLVIDIITAGGNTNPPVVQKIFWAVLEGVVASVLLVGGGLLALQTASITTGLPFAVVLLLACYSLYRGLNSEARRTRPLTPDPEVDPQKRSN